jgi:hypothetical protein
METQRTVAVVVKYSNNGYKYVRIGTNMSDRGEQQIEDGEKPEDKDSIYESYGDPNLIKAQIIHNGDGRSIVVVNNQ